MIKHVLFICLIVFGNIACNCQNASLSKSEALQDFAFLRKQIETIHPNRFFVQAVQEEQRFFQQLSNQIKGPINLQDFYDLVAIYTTSFKDGHTFPSMTLVSDWYQSSLTKGNTVMPFEIDFKEDWFFVKTIYNENYAFIKGARLISLNGHSAKDIIQQFQQFYAKRASKLDNAHARLFKAYFWKSYGNFKYWEITIVLPDGTSRTLKIKGLNQKQLDALQAKLTDEQTMIAPYEFELIANNQIAQLTINFMANPERFSNFIKNVFKEIEEKEIQHLIIDMRKNGGGTSMVGDELYAYLSQTPYLDGRMYVKTSQPIKEWYKRERKGHPLYDFVLAGEKNELVLYPDTSKVIPKKVDHFYTGKSYLITSKKTYSSGHMFAGNFKCNNIGIIVGQETGQATKTVGDAFGFQLPNSKIDISVSYKIFESACELSFTNGFKPHYEITYSSEELKSGVDKEIIFIQQLIRQKRNGVNRQ